MSDFFYGTGYDAGAVVDMNNLAIGYFPRTQVNCGPATISPAPVQAPPMQQQPAAPAIPEEFQRKPKPLDMCDWPFSQPNVFWNLRHWSSRRTRLKLIVWLIGTLPFAGQQLPKNSKHKM